MYIYKVIKENLQNCEFGRYVAYGIAVCLKSTNIILISISDVFLEKERAKRLVELCNKNNLELIHLKEVVEDAVG